MKNYDELEKELPFKTGEGAHPTIRYNLLDELPKDRLILALKRLRKRVETVDLSGYDDTTPGSKNNECTWGLCSDSEELWPDAQDHTFPHDFIDDGRMTQLGYQGYCPMQREKGNGSGCFWYCQFFQRKFTNPTREKYLKMIADKIAELEV